MAPETDNLYVGILKLLRFILYINITKYTVTEEHYNTVTICQRRSIFTYH